MDPVLHKLEEAGYNTIAYADDLAVLLEANHRNELERKGQQAVEIILNWCEMAKLSLSPTKTSLVVFKGGNTSTPPHIYLDKHRIKSVKIQKYLGVYLDPKLNFRAHLEKVCSKGKGLFFKLRRIAGQQGLLSASTLKTIYKGAFVPIVLYCCSVWAKTSSEVLSRRILDSAQRVALLAITRAYRTSATEGLQVLTGILPLDLEAQKLAARYAIRRQSDFWIGEDYYLTIISPNGTKAIGTINEHGSIIDISHNPTIGITNQITNIILQTWQKRWEISHKARSVYTFLPYVTLMGRPNVALPRKEAVWMITNHGPFRDRLAQFKIVDDPHCECGQRDTSSHFCCALNLNICK